MRLNKNLASLSVYREYSKVLNNQSSALQKISSGVKLSSSKDNPNNIASSEKINMQIRGLQMANRNIQDGVSMLQTAEGGMNEITSMLQRVRELTVQAGSDTNNSQDKSIIQSEINQMLDGIDNMAGQTTFNGINLLNDSTGKSIPMVIGANEGETVNIPTYNLTKDSLGLSTGGKLKDIDVVSPGGSDTAISIIDAALDTVISARSKYGAIENRFESGMNETSEMSDKLEGADSNLKNDGVFQR